MSNRCRNLRRPVGVLFALLVVVVGLRPANAAGVAYGEIEIVPETEPRGAFLHGYAEYRFAVKNRSESRPIRVTLQMPGETSGGGRSGNLTSLTKTVEVAPSGVTSIALLQPAAPPIGGGNIAVYIDGRKQEQLLSVSIVSGPRRRRM